MANREKVLELLQAVSPEALTNSEISSRTDITPHQQVFQITESLMSEGLVQGSRTGHEWSFSAEALSVAGADWTNSEFSAAVSAYLDMLRLEQAGVPYDSAAIEASLRQGPLSTRSEKSALFRMRNISAVLQEHGLPSIPSYSPASNVGPRGREKIEYYLQKSGHLQPTGGPSASINLSGGTKVYIANFGRGNYEWPTCKERNTVATMIHEDTRPFYDARDREGFIDWCIANRKAASGLVPTRPVASRWYGAMEAVENTSGDIWIHKAENGLWWTTSKPDAPEWELKSSQDPMQKGFMTWICHKPCEPWSNLNSKGNRLEWGTLHAKAKTFLFTEGTLQKLSPDNAEYALALIRGEDLSLWESLPEWKARAQKAKQAPVTIYNAWDRTVIRIIKTVIATTDNANGQIVERAVKNKDMALSEDELKAHLEELKEAQDSLCAITGIPLQWDGDADDPQLLCSLDRIDSSGHYERGNLQLVCRFINFWKNNSQDAEFRRLIEVVRAQAL